MAASNETPTGPAHGGTIPLGAGMAMVVAVTVDGAVATGGRTAVGMTTSPVHTSATTATLDASRFRTRPWHVFTAFRYSRYDDSDPLEHEVRSTLYDHVRTSPGVYLSALSERADVPLSTVRHHVRILEDEGLVEAEKVDGRRRLAPTTPGETSLRVVDGTVEAVLSALARRGPATGAALADELDRDPSTVAHHLQRLADAGLVDRDRDGRTIVNRVTEAGRAELPRDRDQSSGGRVPATDDD